MSDRITLDESEFVTAPTPVAGPAAGAPWPSGLANPARLGEQERPRRDPRLLWAVGATCSAMVLAGLSFVLGRESRPAPAEIRAQIQRAVQRDRLARTTPPSSRPAVTPRRGAAGQPGATTPLTPTNPKGSQ